MDWKPKKKGPSMRRLYLEFFVLGWVIAGLLYVFTAPIWVCYLAGLPVMPLMVYRLIQLNPPGDEPRLTPKESLTGWLKLCGRRLRLYRP